jgi:hypothetical protein
MSLLAEGDLVVDVQREASELQPKTEEKNGLVGVQEMQGRGEGYGRVGVLYMAA